MANFSKLEQLALVRWSLRVIDQLLKTSFAFFVEIHEKKETAVLAVLDFANERDVPDVLVVHIETERNDGTLSINFERNEEAEDLLRDVESGVLKIWY